MSASVTRPAKRQRRVTVSRRKRGWRGCCTAGGNEIVNTKSAYVTA
eukprot:CAMPEP_0180507880 /NCGR_PEP_ID=MMETSP1036_2-20121128/48855_1 /TAXON_ID=632150 /ORGANISM="Azadinium spinosum, Strain 3D9" /LENGTH=45 /DNA_ID= /DNA_START= /DNA_END= /DNA_ORIENTATION=